MLTPARRFEILRPHTEIHNTSHIRTKTLLLTAALVAAGAASAMAQNVYSVNAVGYANVPMVTGFNLVANPFSVANEQLDSVLSAPPDQTVIYRFVGGTFLPPYTYYSQLPGWDPIDANSSLPLGEGAFLYAPNAFTATFVGEVAQGAPLHNAYPAGFSIKGSKVPQQAALSALGLNNPADQTVVYQFDSAGQTYKVPATFYSQLPGWDTDDPAGPVIKIGEGFWINAPSAGDWTRTFSVN